MWLWAWEKPTDLRFLAGRTDVGVAYLARTITVSDTVTIHPRRQPLLVPEGIPLTTVVRLEVPKDAHPTSATLEAVADGIRDAVRDGRSARVQIDFDARASEITYYRTLLARLRVDLPTGTWLGITALAAWCTNDRSWLADPPDVDGVAPMVFSMGRDSAPTRAWLAVGGGFAVDACRADFGVSTKEPIAIPAETRVLHVFSPDPWTVQSFANVASRWP